MKLCDFYGRVIGPLDRVMHALVDLKRGQAAILGVLAAYVLLWTLYAIISKSTQAIHPDMGEVVVWSRTLEWGTPKHPPLLPALVATWFAVMPLTDSSYYLLAVLTASVAIYISWHLAGIWLDGTKRAVVPFVLMLIPTYNFLALKLDHNAALTPLWALTTYAFVKSFQTRNVWWSMAAGAAAGGALLTKYWSIVLLIGFGVAALLDRRSIAYFKSAAPWVAVLTMVLCFVPHLLWLYQSDFESIFWAERAFADDAWKSVRSAGNYLGGMIAYTAIPLILSGSQLVPHYGQCGT